MIVSVISILHSYPRLFTRRVLVSAVLNITEFLLNSALRSCRSLVLPSSKVEVRQQAPTDLYFHPFFDRALL